MTPKSPDQWLDYPHCPWTKPARRCRVSRNGCGTDPLFFCNGNDGRFSSIWCSCYCKKYKLKVYIYIYLFEVASKMGCWLLWSLNSTNVVDKGCPKKGALAPQKNTNIILLNHFGHESLNSFKTWHVSSTKYPPRFFSRIHSQTMAYHGHI